MNDEQPPTPVHRSSFIVHRSILVFAILALLFTAPGLLPHRVMIPLDLPRDSGAWKADPQQRVIVSNKLLSDAVLEFHAWDVEVRRLVARAEFPWRNRFAGDGAHLFANPESTLLFPLTWLRIALHDRGWALYAMLKLFLAGLGMWWFSRTLTGCDARAAIVPGFVYMTCGYMTVWLLSPHTNVYAMLPWLGASALSLLRAPTRGRVAATIATAALATAGGHPETLFFGVIALAIFFAWQRRDERWRPRAIVLTVASAAIGFAICAVQLVPFLLAVKKSDLLAQRAHRVVQARLFAIPATILPGYLGTPLANEIDLSGIAQPAAENFAERSGGYAGAVLLVALAFAWPRLPQAVRRGMIIGVVALALSWMPSRSLPFATERLGLVFAFFWSAAAQLPLFDSRKSGGLAPSASLRAGAALQTVAIIVAIAGIVLATPFAQPLLTRAARNGIAMLQQRHYLRLPTEIYEARLAHYLAGFQSVAVRRIAIPAFCIATALTRRRKLVLAAIAVEMTLFAYGYNPSMDRSQIAPTPPAIADVLRLDPEHRYLIAAAPGVYPPNLGTADGVRDIRSYDVLQRTTRIAELKRFGYDPVDRSFPDVPRAELSRLGVALYLTRAPLPWPRLGGAPPPAVGVYELPAYASTPMPANTPPPGTKPGAILSLIALLAAFAIVAFDIESFFA